jgi:molybdate transport system regulatory protein
MQTSARNHLHGTVHAVHDGAVNTEVVLDLGGGHHLVAIVTKDSAHKLGLAPGKTAWALVKASWPILVKGAAPATSARNTLCGTVKSVTTGAVNTEVVLALQGGAELVVMITTGSEKTLGLKVGDAACALIKATHVILGVD